jgi:hydroxyethylthiazole kinase-like uncharacterized protein yjeF
MIKILTAQQIRELDAFTIRQEPVSSIDLMERACHAFTMWFVERFSALHKVGIVCGTGNNGGDGLGIARLLRDWGYPVKVWVVRGSVAESEDFKINLRRLQEKKVEIAEISSSADKGLFEDRDVLIDALFGSGLSRPPEGIFAQAIQCINKADVVRVAIDIPSGLMADSTSQGPVVEARYTISFQLPKLAFLLPQNQRFVGEWKVVDIKLSKEFLQTINTSFFFLGLKDARKILKPRSTFDHKGDFGHALVVAGSYGKLGAAVLASRATLRAGVGLLTVHVPQCGYSVLQTAVPEAMVDVDAHDAYLTNHQELDHYSTIGIGPGLGKDAETVKALASILSNFKNPVVIDADALNILSEHRALQEFIPAGSILTPHPKEFQRLAGGWKDDFERLEKQKKLAAQLNAVVIVKGAYSSIASPDGTVYFNSTGNPGMATGGTGDVLTGILTALLAQGYSPVEAACLGVYVHGLAGDIAARHKGMVSMIASDVVEHLPEAFQKVLQ